MSVASAIFIVLAIAASPAAAAIVDVHLKDQNFNPRTVTAKPGDIFDPNNPPGTCHLLG